MKKLNSHLLFVAFPLKENADLSLQSYYLIPYRVYIPRKKKKKKKKKEKNRFEFQQFLFRKNNAERWYVQFECKLNKKLKNKKKISITWHSSKIQNDIHASRFSIWMQME